MKKLCFITILMLAWFVNLQAQILQDQDDLQSWNDVQLTVPLSKHTDFYTSVTLRFG